LTNDVKALQQERIQIYQDIYDNKIPKRVPVDINLPFDFIAQYGGLNLSEAQWDLTMVEDAVDKICQLVYSDKCIFGGSLRYPSFYQALDSQTFKMSSTGFMQHPEVVGMLPEEYNYFIENPYDCLLEKVLPRQYKAFNLDDPVNAALSFAKSVIARQKEMADQAQIINKMVEKYGYYPGGRYAGGITEAPFDFVADFLRGFKGISMDIRRIPEKVAAACEAVYPIVFKMGLPKQISNYGSVFIPLHMAPFMRERDFATLYWPSLKRLVEEYASMGIHCKLFCERDWTRFLDYLYDLPTDTMLWFEYGDPKLIKEKLGKKHILRGLFPIMSLKTKTKEECVKDVKEFIDIMAPGGKFMFDFDKGPLFLNDINLENLCAVTETVRDYAVYSNPGETAGMAFNKEDYKMASMPTFKSKYYKTWEEYKALHPKVSDFAREKLQGLEEAMFSFVTNLLI